MGFFNRKGSGNPVFGKLFGFVVAVATGVVSYQPRGIYYACSFVVLGLLFAYEAFALGVQHRSVRTMERIPFLVVFGILIMIAIIRNPSGGL